MIGENMKKFLCASLLCLTALCFVGCNKTKETIDTLNNHIIEVRNNIYAGSDDTYFATFCSGEREEPYALDGVVNDRVPFGIVTFSKNDNSALNQDTYAFTIVINGETMTGTLEKSPYDNTYSADVETMVDDNAEITLTVNVDSTTFEQVLYNESKNFAVNQTQALEIAGKEMSECIFHIKDQDGKTGEAMVKILKDYSGETNRYFWYVGFVSVEGTTCGVLIDANTGEIVSKKV